jgi:hypothetical protein
MTLNTGHINKWRSDRGFVEEIKLHLILATTSNKKDNKILVTLQHMIGSDRFKFIFLLDKRIKINGKSVLSIYLPY